MENESNNKSVKDTNEKMTRKLTISAILVLFAVGLIIMGVSIDSESAHSVHFDLQKICKAEGCSQQKIDGSDYCSMHKCRDEYCNNQADEGSFYCSNCKHCQVLNCNEERMRDSKFCANHTCGHTGCHEICVDGSYYCVEHQDDENQSFGGSDDSYKNDENQSAGGSYGGGNWAKFSGNWKYSGSLYQGSYIGQVDDGVKYAHLYIDSSNREATITTKNGTYVYALNEIEAFDDGTLYITGTLRNGDSLMGYNWAFLYGSDNLGTTITAFNRADKSGMIFRR